MLSLFYFFHSSFDSNVPVGVLWSDVPTPGRLSFHRGIGTSEDFLALDVIVALRCYKEDTATQCHSLTPFANGTQAKVNIILNMAAVLTDWFHLHTSTLDLFYSCEFLSVHLYNRDISKKDRLMSKRLHCLIWGVIMQSSFFAVTSLHHNGLNLEEAAWRSHQKLARDVLFA